MPNHIHLLSKAQQPWISYGWWFKNWRSETAFNFWTEKHFQKFQGSSAYLCAPIVYLCIILYNDNYNKYIYIYCLLAVILPYVNSVHNMANHQMINPKMSAVSLSSVQDMEVGSAPVESTNTWAPGVSLKLLGGAQAPKKKVVFEKNVPWSTCNGLIRFMVIHPIIGILVLGVCVCVGRVYREIPINGLMTLPQYGYYIVLFYPPFDHGTYSFSSHHFMAVRSSNMVYILKHVETCWNHHQQHFWYS